MNAGQEHIGTADGTDARFSSRAAESAGRNADHVVEGPSLSMPASAFGTGEAKTSTGQQQMQQDRKAVLGHQMQQSSAVLSGLSSDIDAKTKEARAMLDELVVAEGQSEEDVCISKHAFVLISDVVPFISCFHVES